MTVRSDVARNRAAILDAARVLVAQPGDLRLSAVAKRAGVGQGTLYRHFADRDELLRALYEQEVDTLVALAATLVESHEPRTALRQWFVQLAEYARVKGGVIGAVEESVWADLSSRSHGRLGAALAGLLEAGVTAGVLRADVDPRDVILLSWFLAHTEDDEWDQRVPRLLDVLVAGLSDTAPPGP